MTTIRERQSTLARQTQITDAARKLIIEHGCERTGIREIARAVGISEGDIYRHFKSKHDILSLLVDRIGHYLIADINAAGLDRGSPLESLDGLLRSHISAIEQRRGVSFQVIAEIVGLGDRKLNGKVFETITAYVGRVREFLRSGIESGEVREDVDLDAAATLLFGMVQGLVSVWALSQYSFNLEERYVPVWRTFRESIIRR